MDKAPFTHSAGWRRLHGRAHFDASTTGNHLPRPARNERGEGRGEGNLRNHSEARLLSPALSSTSRRRGRQCPHNVVRVGRHALVCLAGFILLAGTARAQYDPGWSRHLRVGAIVGLNIKADFSSTGTTTANSAHAAGVYDDGYVHPTENALGLTGYWGYEHQSQSPRASGTS